MEMKLREKHYGLRFGFFFSIFFLELCNKWYEIASYVVSIQSSHLEGKNTYCLYSVKFSLEHTYLYVYLYLYLKSVDNFLYKYIGFVCLVLEIKKW